MQNVWSTPIPAPKESVLVGNNEDFWNYDTKMWIVPHEEGVIDSIIREFLGSRYEFFKKR